MYVLIAKEYFMSNLKQNYFVNKIIVYNNNQLTLCL